MTLDLDLSPSEAKLARAREHLKALERETTAGIKEEDTYAIRFSEVDPQTGWCSITVVPYKVEKPRLSIILGDLIHNLRCALDYVVTALADASQTALTTAHKFPVYPDATDYAASTGGKAAAVGEGPLVGIKYGLVLIDDWQPYHTQPDPRTDPLWGIHRFSNADKHREPATFLPIPVGSIGPEYDETFSRIVETRGVAELERWTTDQEYVIGYARFEPPRVRNLRAKREVLLDVQFEAPPFRKESSLTIALRRLPSIVEYATKVVNSFRKL